MQPSFTMPALARPGNLPTSLIILRKLSCRESLLKDAPYRDTRRTRVSVFDEYCGCQEVRGISLMLRASNCLGPLSQSDFPGASWALEMCLIIISEFF